MKRYCLALDLKNDEKLMAEYIDLHREIWPEIEDSIKSSGILSMEIYHIENRLFMIMEVDDAFSFDHKAELDRENEHVQKWESLMWKYQQALPTAKPGEKWMLMDKIFSLK